MRKIFLLPAALLLLTAASYGQSTLTAINFNPVIGDAFSVRHCDTTGILPGSAGTSVLWDFSTLIPMGYDTGRVILKAHGTGQSNFPSANIAIKGPTFVSSSTTYYNGTTTSLAQNGYYSAIDTNLIMSNPADQLRYPFTFGTSFSDTYAGILRFGPITAHHNGTINVVCDGWGQLILPSSVHMNVLRVHTTQTFTDSTNLFGTPVFKTYNISSYDWYKPDYHTALLTMQTVTEVGSLTPFSRFVAYADVKFNSVNDIDKEITGLQISPNPTSGLTHIRFNSSNNDAVSATLFDITGKVITTIPTKNTKGDQTLIFNTKDYPKGVYIITIQSGTEAISRKLELQ